MKCTPQRRRCKKLVVPHCFLRREKSFPLSPAQIDHSTSRTMNNGYWYWNTKKRYKLRPRLRKRTSSARCLSQCLPQAVRHHSPNQAQTTRFPYHAATNTCPQKHRPLLPYDGGLSPSAGRITPPGHARPACIIIGSSAKVSAASLTALSAASRRPCFAAAGGCAGSARRTTSCSRGCRRAGRWPQQRRPQGAALRPSAPASVRTKTQAALRCRRPGALRRRVIWVQSGAPQQ